MVINRHACQIIDIIRIALKIAQMKHPAMSSPHICNCLFEILISSVGIAYHKHLDLFCCVILHTNLTFLSLFPLSDQTIPYSFIFRYISVRARPLWLI